jgi:biopolymer transport protein ExbD
MSTMGMSTSGSRFGINVTPLIDILLVLLIVFLVAMPIVMRMETVAVPPTDPGAEPPWPPVLLSLKADLGVAVDDGPPLAPAELATRLRARSPKLVFLEVEDGVPWNDVVSTVDTVRGAADGVTVALKTGLAHRDSGSP